MFDQLKESISAWILRFLAKPTARYAPFFAPEPEVVRRALQPGDVLLIEGNTRLSAIIKFLTQSTWSHAALYVGERPGDVAPDGEPNVLLEAEAEHRRDHRAAVEVRPFQHCGFAGRSGSSAESKQKVVDYALARIGKLYDSRQIIDLARYLFPYPPVPVWFRRRMLSIGSGDPTKAICSTLIAEAFASIHYPILPESVSVNGKTYGIAPYVQSEIDHIRKHGLYTPRDFDVSPYFSIVKPSLDDGFDYHKLVWAPPTVLTAARVGRRQSDRVDRSGGSARRLARCDAAAGVHRRPTRT